MPQNNIFRQFHFMSSAPNEEIVVPKDMEEEPKEMEQPQEFEQPEETALSVFDDNDEWERVCTTDNSPASSLSVSMTLDELKAQETARMLDLSKEKFTNSISDITFLVPTPKCIYPPDHKNAKFKLLNTLNVNVMDRSAGAAGLHSRAQMETLI